METTNLIRPAWIFLMSVTALMVISFAALYALNPVDPSPSSERWFYFNAAFNFLAVISALLLRHFTALKSLPASSNNKRNPDNHAVGLATIAPLYVAACFAATATFFGKEPINLLFTGTYFAASYYLFPSRKKLTETDRGIPI